MNFQADVAAELARARSKHPGKQNGLHEGYAVLMEEVDEFWDLVKSQKPAATDVYDELVQVAAMAQRTAEDVLRDRIGFGSDPNSGFRIVINGRPRLAGFELTHHQICLMAGTDVNNSQISYRRQQNQTNSRCMRADEVLAVTEGTIIDCTDSTPTH